MVVGSENECFINFTQKKASQCEAQRMLNIYSSYSRIPRGQPLSIVFLISKSIGIIMTLVLLLFELLQYALAFHQLVYAVLPTSLLIVRSSV